MQSVQERNSIIVGFIILSLVGAVLGVILALVLIGHGLIEHFHTNAQGLNASNCSEVTWLGYDACGHLPTRDNTVNYVNEGDAWDVQPAAGYRLLTPLATGQYHVFNEEYNGPQLQAVSQ